METLLSIGAFSRMTFLSVKALRHYHEVGVLEPARIDPDTGYRYYRPGQVWIAQVVRRFRDLGMPLDEVRTLVSAPDSRTRNKTIIAHLERMEHHLEQTRETVASLRVLLQDEPGEPQVEYRSESPIRCLAVIETVSAQEAVGWWMAAFEELHRALSRLGAARTGPDGALFSDDFFTVETGEVTAFVPVDPPPGSAGTPDRPVAPGRPVRFEIPAADLAVVTHNGPFSDLDRAYGELGLWVTERALAAPGPVRERYLPLGDPRDLLNHRTEVCWPVTAAGWAWAGG